MRPDVSRKQSPLAATAILLALLIAPRAEAQRSSTQADSLHADSLAFATLPAAVLEVLDVRTRITPESADPNLVCVGLTATSDGSKRQRLQGRLGDGTSLVVFARENTRRVLGRVEFVRRLHSGEQRGYTWDVLGDATVASEWKAGGTAATSYPIPRGGPIPRAVRSLGRLVMQWNCPHS